MVSKRIYRNKGLLVYKSEKIYKYFGRSGPDTGRVSEKSWARNEPFIRKLGKYLISMVNFMIGPKY